jgi:hypothetical protein
LRLHTGRETNGEEQAPGLERCERTAIAVLADAVENDVEPARDHTREVFALVIDRRAAQLADQRCMLAARRAPQFEAGQPAEDEQRLTDCAGGSMHEHMLASLHVSRAMQELICGHPAQDQRRGLGRVDVRRHTRQVVRAERSISCVRSDHRHVGDAVANLEVAHAIAELVDFPDDVITHHERRSVARSLRVEVAPYQYVRVLQARGKHVDPYLAAAGRRQDSVDHLQPVGTPEAADLNNPIARLCHGRLLG